MLVSMTFWVYLLLIAASIAASLLLFYKNARKDARAIVFMAFFLAVFDFVFETIGALAGYWTSHNSLLALGFVPAEVFGIALCAGAAFRVLFPNKFLLKLAVSSSLLVACIGAGIESLLIDHGNLIYAGGWNSYHAFAAYFLVFLFMHWVNARVK